MSELPVFKEIKRIVAIDTNEQSVANYILKNRSNFKQSDMPDLVFDNQLLSQNSIGIEHTEVSIFKEGKKGAEIRKSHRELSSEVIKIELEYIEISCVDIQPHYKRKLRLNDGKTLIDNIVNAIKLKSKKAKNYKSFNINILWIETEDFLEHHRTLPLNKKIKNAIDKCPFDSILIGNANLTYYISKKLLKNAAIPPVNSLAIHTNKNFDQTYRILKDTTVEITVTNNTTRISKNVTEHYAAYIKFKLNTTTPTPLVAKLFVNNLELNVTKADRDSSENWVVTATYDEITLNFNISNKKIEFNHSLKANKGDSFHLDLASKRSSTLQKCLTGVINIIIQENNTIEHFKHIPSQQNKSNWKIKESNTI